MQPPSLPIFITYLESLQQETLELYATIDWIFLNRYMAYKALVIEMFVNVFILHPWW